jgi:hypothetical protein
MEEQRLRFEVMLSYLHRALKGVEDPRQPSNTQRYSLRDLVLGAFSVFYMQLRCSMTSFWWGSMARTTFQPPRFTGTNAPTAPTETVR